MAYIRVYLKPSDGRNLGMQARKEHWRRPLPSAQTAQRHSNWDYETDIVQACLLTAATTPEQRNFKSLEDWLCLRIITQRLELQLKIGNSSQMANREGIHRPNESVKERRLSMRLRNVDTSSANSISR